GATTASYNDIGAPADGSGRYYRCVLNASGAAQQTSAANRGYRMIAPTVTTTTPASDIGVTTATCSGDITATGGENASERGICYGTSANPDTSGSKVTETGSFGTGAFSEDLTGLSSGTTYHFRAYAINSAGTSYGADQTLITRPEAPTNVSATEDNAAKVTITWTKSMGATDYHVWRGTTDLGSAGDVATFDDTTASPPTITAGSSVATDGTQATYVGLSLSGGSVADGTSYSYKVVAENAIGSSADSNTDTGYRKASAWTCQWQRSAGDSDASYSDIGGATTASYNDIGAPADGSGRYYRCVLNASGAAQQTSAANRGYRGFPAPTVTSVTPDSGLNNADTTITSITGTGFRTGATVELGTMSVTNPVVESDDRITCVFPTATISAGVYGVTVTNTDGESDTLADCFTVNNPVPAITTLGPTSKTTGGPAFTLTVNGTGFNSTSVVRWNGSDRTATCVSNTRLAATIYASDIASKRTASVTVFNPAPGGGTSNAQMFTVNEPPPIVTYYLAEGTSDWGFDTYVTIQNPNDTSVTAEVTYMTKDGEQERPDIPLYPNSQTVINPRNDIGSMDFSTRVICEEGKTIAVDRRMVWTGRGAPSQEGHSSIGVTSPAKTWYLPEGSSKWGFETWLLIQNPNNQEASCTVTYMTEAEGPKAVNHTVPANSRASFNMETDIGQQDASIKVDSNVEVIPERAMYRNDRREGHCSIGTTTPARDYYLAEGTTDWGFTTYVLIQNPNESENTVTVTYMTPEGPQPQGPFTMSANSRKTLKVNEALPAKDLSTHVQGTQTLIAERAMYWDKGTGEACHDSVGMDSPHTNFYLPDGETQNGMETWTLVQNPNSSEVTVEISYLTPDGAGNVTFEDTVPANSRKTYNMSDRIPAGRAAIMVTSTTSGKKIMCERAMYWNSRGAGTDTIGGYSD
ncbi:MAG: hypothetical protein ACYC99_04365, partial [Candidatus Geothermincolia bacterium]